MKLSSIKHLGPDYLLSGFKTAPESFCSCWAKPTFALSRVNPAKLGAGDGNRTNPRPKLEKLVIYFKNARFGGFLTLSQRAQLENNGK